MQEQSRYLDYLIDPSFQRVNKLFVLSHENITGRTSYKQYYLPRVETKDYNVMTDGQNFFNQTVKDSWRTYKNIPNKTTVHGDDYTTGCLLDYFYFKN